jgi:uncharacterized protein (DUF58 family)
LFTGLAIIVVFFVVSYFLPQFLFATKIGLLSWLTFALMDFVVLFWTHQGITAHRVVPEKFSNGDENPIQIHLINYYTFPIYTKIIDEIPFQFQKRDFIIHQKIGSASSKSFYYNLRPTERGEYWFGKLIVYVQSPFRLLSRRFNFGTRGNGSYLSFFYPIAQI